MFFETVDDVRMWLAGSPAGGDKVSPRTIERVVTVPGSLRDCTLKAGCLGQMGATLRQYANGSRELWWYCHTCHKNFSFHESEAVPEKAPALITTTEEATEENDACGTEAAIAGAHIRDIMAGD